MIKPILKPAMLAALLASAVQAMALDPSGTLPVLYIETPNRQAITSKEDYISDTKYWLDPMGQEGVEAIGSKEEPLIMQIRGRGNYTWTGFEKKPYRLKLDKKQPMLGMDKSKHWALMAQADDNLGFMRMPLTFKLSELCGLAWTPQEQPVEVVLNGDYIGLYFLTQTVRVDTDRVDIFEQDDNSDASVSGGWLLEIDNYEDPAQIKITEGDGSEMMITYKSPEVLCKAQEDFLRSQMEAIDKAFYQTSPESTDWEKLVDKESLAAYYIVQEMTDNYESFHGSCYFYRNQGENEKWHWGPVWDTGSVYMRGGGEFIHQSQYHQTWIPEVVKFTSFQTAYHRAMESFILDHYAEVAPYINACAAHIAAAAKRDAERWPQYANPDVPAKAAEIISLFRNRVNWLSEQWNLNAEVPGASGIYLRGTMTNWEPQPMWEFTKTGDYVYELRNVEIDGKFKIGGQDWNTVNYGKLENQENPVADVPFALAEGEISKDMEAHGSFTRVELNLDPEAESATLLLSTKADDAGIESAATTSATVSAIYNLQGIKVSAATAPGLYVVVYSDGSSKKIAVK